MLTASCPNCSSPVTFKHSASVAAVCSSCDSTITRDDEELKLVGKVSSFSRDLSPLQIGVQGSIGSRQFELAGVIRRARKGVRWNEWHIIFDDGLSGWLSEGNGQYMLFADPPQTNDVPSSVSIGESIECAGEEWVVTEDSGAMIIAAQGELPYSVIQDQIFKYADLRSTVGRKFATLDFEEAAPVFWVGHLVELSALELSGLRAFAGWADETEVNFNGPEIKSTRSLDCPSCGAPIVLRAPGDTVTVGCEYCGSTVSANEGPQGSILKLERESQEAVARFDLPLGTRLKMEGHAWEVIGAVLRGTHEDGEFYPWQEFCLRNPYVGYRWLIRSDQSWSWGGPVKELPSPSDDTMEYQGKSFKLFSAGNAEVAHVVGEFTWQVSIGDKVKTWDFIAPPLMLSREMTSEESGSEISWTAVEWTPGVDIRDALQGDVELDPELWVDDMAPNRPNPWSEKGLVSYALKVYGALVLAWLVLVGMLLFTPANKSLFAADFQAEKYEVSKKAYVFISDTFKVPDQSRRSLEVRVETTEKTTSGSKFKSDLNLNTHVALLNKSTGDVYLINSGNNNNVVIPRVKSGDYVLRVEQAPSPNLVKMNDKAAAAGKKPTEKTKVWVSIDPANDAALGISCVFIFLLIIGPIMFVFFRQMFEGRRWRDSNV